MRVFVPALTFLILAACAAPPTAQLEEARQALNAAETAEADVYAETQYQSAAQLLAEAEAEIADEAEASAFDRDYAAASDLLTRAKADADAAAAAAPEAREQTRAQAETSLGEARQAIQTAVESLDRIRVTPRNQTIVEGLRTELTSVREALGLAESSLTSGDYREALDRVQQVREQAAVVQEKIQTTSGT